MEAHKQPTCRFCNEPAIGRFSLSDGCAVYPDDREQNLCWHHAREATPRGSFVLAEDHTLSGKMRVVDLMKF